MELNNGKLRLHLVPEIGGSIVDFSANVGGQWLPIMRCGEEPLSSSSNASSFVLIPYSNRVRDGRFSFAGKSYQLRHADKHAIHGDVRDRPLKVLDRGEFKVVLEFNSEEVPDLNFPFPFSARMTYAVDGFELRRYLCDSVPRSQALWSGLARWIWIFATVTTSARTPARAMNGCSTTACVEMPRSFSVPIWWKRAGRSLRRFWTSGRRSRLDRSPTMPRGLVGPRKLTNLLERDGREWQNFDE